MDSARVFLKNKKSANPAQTVIPIDLAIGRRLLSLQKRPHMRGNDINSPKERINIPIVLAIKAQRIKKTPV
jgi:hypothetical protein